MKLRASVGSTGTTNFSSTQALTTYLYDFSREYNGNFGVSLAGYGNSSLKWQTTLSYNVGVDFTFLHGLVVFNGDFYIKNTRSLLLPVTVAPSTGFIDYVENIGKLRNTGVEARLRFNLIQDAVKDLRWNVTLSAFHNRVRLPNYPISWKPSINMPTMTGQTRERWYIVSSRRDVHRRL